MNTLRYFDLPNAPAIPGLAFRYWQDENDFARMAEIYDIVGQADQFESTMTAIDMASVYGKSVNCDPQSDVFFAEVHGEPIAFGHSFTYQEANGTWVYFPQGRVLPSWRRKGLGRAMLRYDEQHLRAIAATHPVNGARTFKTFALNTAIGAATLLTQENYQPVRYTYLMVRDTLDNIPTARLPEGIETRPVIPEQYRQIWEVENEVFQNHWGFDRPTEEGYQRLWRVAWDGDQIVGLAQSLIKPEENQAQQRQRGFTESICVRKPWRKRGIARALIAQSLAAIRERGMMQAALRVDTQNADGALNLYESSGYRMRQCTTEYRKPFA